MNCYVACFDKSNFTVTQEKVQDCCCFCCCCNDTQLRVVCFVKSKVVERIKEVIFVMFARDIEKN